MSVVFPAGTETICQGECCTPNLACLSIVAESVPDVWLARGEIVANSSAVYTCSPSTECSAVATSLRRRLTALCTASWMSAALGLSPIDTISASASSAPRTLLSSVAITPRSAARAAVRASVMSVTHCESVPLKGVAPASNRAAISASPLICVASARRRASASASLAASTAVWRSAMKVAEETESVAMSNGRIGSALASRRSLPASSLSVRAFSALATSTRRLSKAACTFVSMFVASTPVASTVVIPASRIASRKLSATAAARNVRTCCTCAVMLVLRSAALSPATAIA